MANDLDALEDWAGVLLSKLQPAARNKLARALAQQLRRSQQQQQQQQQPSLRPRPPPPCPPCRPAHR